MFYYLIYNSALGNYQEHSKRYLTTFLYGSILYLVIHAYLYSSSNSFHQSLRFYFWMIWVIDILSIAYISSYLEEQLELEDNNGISMLSLLGDIKDKISSKKEESEKKLTNNNNNNNNQKQNNENFNNENQDKEDRSESYRGEANLEQEIEEITSDDNFGSLLNDFGSTLLEPQNSKKEIDPRGLVYNANEFDIPNQFQERSDSQSPIFSDFGSDDDDDLSGSGSDLDLDDFRASLES